MNRIWGLGKTKREFQSKDKTVRPLRDTEEQYRAPHYPGVPDIGNMKMLLAPTKCLWIEYSTTNFEYLKP